MLVKGLYMLVKGLRTNIYCKLLAENLMLEYHKTFLSPIIIFKYIQIKLSYNKTGG